jgi:hypothetical protein
MDLAPPVLALARRGRTLRPTDGSVRLGTHLLFDDTITSGFAATIGASAFLLWHSFKACAEHDTGLSPPSYSKLMRLTGFSRDSVWRLIKTLEHHRLLRRVSGGNRLDCRYMTRECIAVRDEKGAVVAALLFDYIPTRTFHRVEMLKAAFAQKRPLPDGIEVWAAPGYLYDPRTGLLHTRSEPA